MKNEEELVDKVSAALAATFNPNGMMCERAGWGNFAIAVRDALLLGGEVQWNEVKFETKLSLQQVDGIFMTSDGLTKAFANFNTVRYGQLNNDEIQAVSLAAGRKFMRENYLSIS